ncbi:unnamed protein product [Camellia sinensis]
MRGGNGSDESATNVNSFASLTRQWSVVDVCGRRWLFAAKEEEGAGRREWLKYLTKEKKKEGKKRKVEKERRRRNRTVAEGRRWPKVAGYRVEGHSRVGSR